jgi:hypothetical protein
MSAVLCDQAECGVGHVQPLESTWGTEWWLEETSHAPSLSDRLARCKLSRNLSACLLR